ncbi:hypothetical protein FGB62_42g20 [Gracilaria domingensis]|nr:hypothetical protein FGB62_42g20 [Gracilaria domingensis]
MERVHRGSLAEARADKGVLEREGADGTGEEGAGLGLVGRGFRPKQHVVGLCEVSKELNVHMAVGAGEFGRGGGTESRQDRRTYNTYNVFGLDI